MEQEKASLIYIYYNVSIVEMKIIGPVYHTNDRQTGEKRISIH